MAGEKFSFMGDYIEKAVRLPWLFLLAVIAHLMPRDRNLWVFGRRTGVGDGPLALLRAVQDRYPDARCIWLVRDEADLARAHSAGIEAVRRDSLHALALCLRAGTGVMTNGFSDLRGPAIWGARTVQLWHGAPLKRIGFDRQISSGALITRLARKFERYWNSHYSYVVAGSAVTAERLGSAMGVVGKVQPVGDPRMDLIGAGMRQARQALAAAAGVESAEGRKFILLAPTWRDGDGDPNVTPLDSAVDQALGEDCYLFVRAHPHSRDLAHLFRTPQVVALPPAEYPDITSLLGGFDALMTDYSSIAIDFAPLGRPVVFCAPDLEEYERSPGLYEPYREFTQDTWYEDWTSAFEALPDLLRQGTPLNASSLACSAALASRFHPFGTHGNSDRLLRLMEQGHDR